MEFVLPQQLQQELLSYDPTFKKLHVKTKTTPARKKAKYPFGQPGNLIPTDVVPQDAQEAAVNQISNAAVEDRLQVFTRVKEDTISTYAILYHYERVWYAAWLPPVGREDDYVYGYSFVYKDTNEVRNSLPYIIRNKVKTEDLESIRNGRSFYWGHRKLVTKKDIVEGCVDAYWNIPGIHYQQKTVNLRPVISGFSEQIKKSIPTWEDSLHMFDRLRFPGIGSVIFEHTDVHQDYKEVVNTLDWKPSYEALRNIIAYHEFRESYYGEKYRAFNQIIHIIDKPFFRKWIQAKCEECLAKFEDPTTTTRRQVRQPWRQIEELLTRIYTINSIWPDCPIDYYQNHLDHLIGVRIDPKVHSPAKEWIRNNMPVASFFGNLSKFYKASIEGEYTRTSFSKSLGEHQFRFRDWNDTVEMIQTLLGAEKEVPIPKRWRMEEFHNTVQAEAWKIKNPNELLPQDLFPEPIKLEYGNNSWTLFQPHDTHQLALWGQAVRNCVGSASSYAKGVRERKHFLVLCMINKQPRFTVQLGVDMGVMRVKQIVNVSNQRLTPDEQTQYAKAFADALQVQENRLKSDQLLAASD